jgi:signal transduction histidine kinase
MDAAPQSRAQEAQRLLAEASDLLASTLDYEETLAGVARLAVRSLADFCIIDILESGELKRLQVAHADPAMADLTQQLLAFPLEPGRAHISLQALETGQSILVTDVDGALLDTLSQNAEHRRILGELKPRSHMAVPLQARDRLLGVVLFVSSTHDYSEEDLAVAEKLVHLAALEVDNARLYREAQQALLGRDRVLGIVAHDLRSPLNVITMGAQFLLEVPLPEPQRQRHLTMILQSAQRMNRLIQDLLDVARIDADRLYLQRLEHDPVVLGEEAVELSRALADAKSLRLEFTASATSHPVSVDRDRILQVLGNLIGNAIKFTPDGGRIEVRVDSFRSGARFAIADTGPGIPDDALPRLYEPFWQARLTSLDGAGLGLMIARGIVEAHGGRIWVETKPGRGSVFRFTIPAQTPVRHSGERRRWGAERRRTGDAPGA